MYPLEIDIDFLKMFRKCILRNILNGHKFIIVAGGGKIARKYQEATQKICKVNNEDKDWLGIHATRLNAHLLRTIFKEKADPVVIDEHNKIKKLNYSITIASGWRPGSSTDYIAAQLAVDFKINEYIISGKPSYVYDKDFVKYLDAKPYFELNWLDYSKLIPKKWIPGFHSPVDPVATNLSLKNNLTAIVVNGGDLKNFNNLINVKEFKGTIIS